MSEQITTPEDRPEAAPVELRTLPTEAAIKDAIKQGWWPNTRDRLSFSYRKATRAVLDLFAAQPTVTPQTPTADATRAAETRPDLTEGDRAQTDERGSDRHVEPEGER